MKKTLITLLILCLSLLIGCSGSSEKGQSKADTITATYQSLDKHIFTGICANCHIPGHPSQLVMYKQDIYAKLVNQKSRIQGKTYIIPGDSKNSLVVQYFTGASPNHYPLLPAKVKEKMIQWIDEGAKRN